MSVLSLFSGAGGDSLGFKLAGFDVQMAVDLDRDCCRTYSRNLKSVDVYRKDVRDLDLRKKEFKGLLFPLPKLNIIGTSGGTPCQDSSVLNKSSPKNPKDGRDVLVFEPIRLAKQGNLEFLLLENVPNFGLKEEAMKAGRDAGYHMFDAVLSTADYGAPQNRKRWFVVGLRDYDTFQWPTPMGPPPTIQDTIDKMDRTWGVSERTTPEMIQAMEQLDLTPGKWVKVSGNSWKNGIAWYPDGIANCVTHTQKTYMKLVGRPGKIPQSLAAMLQGFPNSWKFLGNMDSIGQQITNACPSLLVKSIALQIKRRLSL